MKFNIKKNLSKRERYAIYAAMGAVGIFLFVQFLVFPVLDKRDRLSKELKAKNRAFEEMRLLKTEYDAINKQSDLSKINFKNREKGFTLFSFLDKLSGQVGIKPNIDYMKPSSTTSKNGSRKLSQVELKLKGINLRQLTSYLYRIETSKNIVFVKRLSISRSTKPEGFIDVVLQVETFAS